MAHVRDVAFCGRGTSTLWRGRAAPFHAGFLRKALGAGARRGREAEPRGLPRAGQPGRPTGTDGADEASGSLVAGDVRIAPEGARPGACTPVAP